MLVSTEEAIRGHEYVVAGARNSPKENQGEGIRYADQSSVDLLGNGGLVGGPHLGKIGFSRNAPE